MCRKENNPVLVIQNPADKSIFCRPKNEFLARKMSLIGAINLLITY
tara:strand:- start:9595 stop:9732 length:138 start_codon:yes stop_codon:yes gene_type:complete